jgi:GGDEF domain-containing protein
MGLTDPRSGLPSGRLIEDQLREMIRKPEWAYMDIRISYFDAFREKYGFVAADEVLRFTAMMIGEIVDQNGTKDDFIGNAGNDNFVLITLPDKKDVLKETLEKRFDEEVKSHYSFVDREAGGIKIDDGMGGERFVKLMRAAVGAISSKDKDWSDIREITEAAAEARRKAQQAINTAGAPGATAGAPGAPGAPTAPTTTSGPS